MKKILFTITLALTVMVGSVYASFPVKKEKASEAQEQVASTENSPIEGFVIDQEISKISEKEQAIAEDDRYNEEDWITIALWAFLWPLAAHRWYRKKPIGWNILFILTFGGCGVWAVIDLIKILTKDF